MRGNARTGHRSIHELPSCHESRAAGRTALLEDISADPPQANGHVLSNSLALVDLGHALDAGPLRPGYVCEETYVPTTFYIVIVW